MLLANLQDHLSLLYEAPIAHRVTDFLITDARLARALEDGHAPRDNAERLLLRQDEDCLDVSLYIDDDVLASLAGVDPWTRLDRRNLNDFLIALEGVSHFHYLVWSATHARQVTQLELELQAEVDKYVTAAMLREEQGTDDADLHETLFEAVSFDPALDAETGARYRTANHYAAKYCRGLARRHRGRHHDPACLNELRRFYRLSQQGKMRMIDRPPS